MQFSTNTMQIRSNGINLEAELHGAPDAMPVLMIMGLGMQLVSWPPELIDALASRGLRPIVFDNRDVGLASKFDAWGRPNLVKVSLQHALRLPIRAPYLLTDMARDALGVLDALGIERAHVVGVSMGGMIAQLLAGLAPTRIGALTLVMTSTGSRKLPGPTMAARRALLSRPAGSDIGAQIEHGVRVWRTIGSPKYPASDASLRARVERSIRRAWHPEGVARQLVSVIASGERSAQVARITQATLVIHGRDDPLVPAACGIELAAKVPRASLQLIDGMGHDMPVELAPSLATMIATHCAGK